jgi:hypothetical protein
MPAFLALLRAPGVWSMPSTLAELVSLQRRCLLEWARLVGQTDGCRGVGLRPCRQLFCRGHSLKASNKHARVLRVETTLNQPKSSRSTALRLTLRLSADPKHVGGSACAAASSIYRAEPKSVALPITVISKPSLVPKAMFHYFRPPVH